METILVLAPHPDDDILGCGGSMARHIQRGNHVAIVYMTSGEDGSLEYSAAELGLIREAEAKSAALKLGVTDLTFLRCPDGYLEYSKDNISRIVTIIRTKKPHIIYLPHSNDAVPDHRITYQLGLEGCRRAAGPWHQKCGQEPWSVKTILGYEIWTPLQEVGHSENISEFITPKIEAIQLHKSQTEHINYHEAIQGLNRYRGIMTGKGKYCECFQLIRTQIFG
jgi:LmbE family N-acetylglucosaminyl deacetylase